MDNAMDLHIHSIYSDGTSSPSEIVDYGKRISLKAMSLTDHESVGGLLEMSDACKEAGIDFISGIELSTDYHGIEVHLLGYGFDINDENLLKSINEIKEARSIRTGKIVSLLEKEGFDITMDKLKDAFPSSTINRANIAQYLVETGQLSSIKHVFDKYIGDDCPCYVSERNLIPIEVAIKVIHKAKGITSLAHPTLYGMNYKEIETMIAYLKDNGLDGIESYYSTYHNEQGATIRAFATKYSLFRSGGSDYHGANKPYIHLGSGKGNLHVPYTEFGKMIDYYNSIYQ